MQTSMIFENHPDHGEVLLQNDGKVVLYTSAVASQRATELFSIFAADLAWKAQDVFVYGKWIAQPRLTAWYGDPDKTYRYSGIELHPHRWTSELSEVREVCEKIAGVHFNSVLANLYRDGRDGVAWHADDEPELGENPVIASVSLGQERRFDLRHRETGETIRTLLPSGSVLVMAGSTQHHWLHQVPKTAKQVGPRINLTFRFVHV
jgi:alkylated DNA repair dioxygenase AlkB